MVLRPLQVGDLHRLPRWWENPGTFLYEVFQICQAAGLSLDHSESHQADLRPSGGSQGQILSILMRSWG
jgi:hypothetical protein